MVDWSIEAMREAPSVRSIVVACPPGHIHDLGGHDLGVVDGGETRAVSVANALERGRDRRWSRSTTRRGRC